jgi:hypothetical protein
LHRAPRRLDGDRGAAATANEGSSDRRADPPYDRCRHRIRSARQARTRQSHHCRRAAGARSCRSQLYRLLPARRCAPPPPALRGAARSRRSNKHVGVVARSRGCAHLELLSVMEPDLDRPRRARALDLALGPWGEGPIQTQATAARKVARLRAGQDEGPRSRPTSTPVRPEQNAPLRGQDGTDAPQRDETHAVSVADDEIKRPSGPPGERDADENPGVPVGAFDTDSRARHEGARRDPRLRWSSRRSPQGGVCLSLLQACFKPAPHEVLRPWGQRCISSAARRQSAGPRLRSARKWGPGPMATGRRQRDHRANDS